MFPRALFSICFLLISGSALQAGALVSLVPASPANGVSYLPGEQVRVDFYVQMDAASPATIRTRLLQFDLAGSSPGFHYMLVQNHPLADIGPIPFWNLSSAPACAGDEAQCGTNYFIEGRTTGTYWRGILNLTYIGLTTNNDLQVILRQASPTLVGSLEVMMPPMSGNFVLDVLNANEADNNYGAELRYGFGSAEDPGINILRAEDGQIVMVPGASTDEFGRVAFAVIPEPTTLALLGLGGLALMLRRRLTHNKSCHLVSVCGGN